MINLAVEAPETPMAVGAVIVIDGRALCDADGRPRLAAIRAALDRRMADAAPLRRIVHRPGPLAGRPGSTTRSSGSTGTCGRPRCRRRATRRRCCAWSPT
jgi:hypothetical protein